MRRQRIWKLAASLNRLLSEPDAPHRIAHGLALGLAVDFFPLPLVSIPVACLLARLLRANIAAAALSAAFFKWAVPFFYALNLLTGSALLGGEAYLPVKSAPSSLFFSFREAKTAFLAGAILNAVLSWAVSYLLARRLLAARRPANPKERNGCP